MTPGYLPLVAWGSLAICVGVKAGLWFAKQLILDTYFARKARRTP